MSIKSRWSQLHGGRSEVLTRARAHAGLTIPSLLPPEGTGENAVLPQPYQSLGARGVNNLASKLLLALFPPGSAFFRLNIEPNVLEAMGAKAADAEEALRKIESRIITRIERGTLRSHLHQAIKHLVVIGSALLYLPTNGMYRMFGIDKFCVVRDGSGRVLELVIKETIAPEALPENVQEACGVKQQLGETTAVKRADVDVYTHVVYRDERHEWHQEINDIRVPGSEGSAPADSSPFLAMRWISVAGENYGRSHVEEYSGDLRSLEGLTAAILAFAAAAAKVVPILKPNSVMTTEDLSKPSGQVVVGNPEDVTLLQMEKFADFQVAKAVIDDLNLRLSHAFLLQSGTVRNAERVTAAEIQAMAQELEDVLGGVYSVQGVETQLPIVRRFMAVMLDEGAITPLPGVEPAIVTGFEALGRGHTLNRLRGFFQDAVGILGPEAVLAEVRASSVLQVLATSHNIDSSDLFKTDEEKEQDQQQAAAAQMMEKAAGPMASAMTKQVQSD